MEKIEFWTELESGEKQVVQDGFFIRNDLFKFFEKLEESGRKPVGIRFDGSWNLEIICTVPVK